MNLPQDFLIRMEALLGDEYPAFLRSYEEPRRYGLRVNTLKISVEEFLRIAPFHLTPIPWTDNGFFYEKEDAPSRHPFYYAGLYYLQEPSAMTPAQLLPVEPGERVLDLCAAPGGKATALAAKLQARDLAQCCPGAEHGAFPPGGLLVANDISASRAKALLKNLEVFGAANSFVTCTTPTVLAGYFPEFFDKILVDAPCSGEGMFRKDVANANAWSLEKVRNCAKTQKDIVGYAVSMLRPGGMLLYSTCTFAPEEDEQVLAYLLETHPELELVPVPMAEGFCAGRPELALDGWQRRTTPEACTMAQKPCQSEQTIVAEKSDGKMLRCEQSAKDSAELHMGTEKNLKNCIRLFPHKIPGEGHFLALLQKRGGEKPPANLDFNDSANDTMVWSQKSGKAAKLAKLVNCAADARYTKLSRSKKTGNTGRASNRSRAANPDLESISSFLDQILNDEHVMSELLRRCEIHNGQAYYVPEALDAVSDCVSRCGSKQSGERFQFQRKGLYLGELKKDRFEPSQAFAMALRAGDCAAVIDLDYTDERVLRYLRGETIEVEDDRDDCEPLRKLEKGNDGVARAKGEARLNDNTAGARGTAQKNGWRLVCVNGCPLGWGKLVNGTLKNKYHPGWRMQA
ncbi:MAG: RsmB/NOP family class I SAM-dependent RNA methyltransferase [Lachnospiraceae bacterium]|nr:RsmB/NOP family class I SAM-dependent RNA methyltransferase [Lachnospiraceae bacterium]